MGTPVGDRNNLIMAAQTGDAAALSRLLAVCQADARRYAYKHCHASDVDDAVQESLLIISRKVSGLKAAAAFSSWLFTVIKHECRKLARMMFKHEPLPDEVAEELLLHRPDDRHRPARRCAAGGGAESLRREPGATAIGRVSLRQRPVVEFRKRESLLAACAGQR